MSKASGGIAGVVSADEIYTVGEFKARMGMGAWALRMARRSGLPVLKLGRRHYIRGADVLTFLDREAAKVETGQTAGA